MPVMPVMPVSVGVWERTLTTGRTDQGRLHRLALLGGYDAGAKGQPADRTASGAALVAWRPRFNGQGGRTRRP
jgi:hypothetical protein